MSISELHIAFKVEADKNAVNIGMSGCPSFLPEEIEEKFSQLMLELRAQLLKENKKNIQWKVKKENNQIIIYPKER